MVQYYRVKDPIENLNIRLHWKEENEDGGGGTTHKSRVIHWQEKIKPEESEALYSFYTLIDFELEVYELDDIKEAEKNRKSIKMMRIYLRCNKNDTDSKLCTIALMDHGVLLRVDPGFSRPVMEDEEGVVHKTKKGLNLFTPERELNKYFEEGFPLESFSLSHGPNKGFEYALENVNEMLVQKDLDQVVVKESRINRDPQKFLPLRVPKDKAPPGTVRTYLRLNIGHTYDAIGYIYCVYEIAMPPALNDPTSTHLTRKTGVFGMGPLCAGANPQSNRLIYQQVGIIVENFPFMLGISLWLLSVFCAILSNFETKLWVLFISATITLLFYDDSRTDDADVEPEITCTSIDQIYFDGSLKDPGDKPVIWFSMFRKKGARSELIGSTKLSLQDVQVGESTSVLTRSVDRDEQKSAFFIGDNPERAPGTDAILDSKAGPYLKCTVYSSEYTFPEEEKVEKEDEDYDTTKAEAKDSRVRASAPNKL